MTRTDEKPQFAISGHRLTIMKSKLHLDCQLCPLRLFACACFLAALGFGNIARSQQCVSPPSGIVAWWAADGDATDLEGNHNGTLFNGTTFATGEVGQAFNFDSAPEQHQYVDVGLTRSDVGGMCAISSSEVIQRPNRGN